MRISTIKCNNFKSLVDFEIPLAKFSCLLGLNGSGKSTVLQFVDFLAQLVRGRMDTWLEERSWTAQELVFQLDPSTTIPYTVELTDETTGSYLWSGDFDIVRLKCVNETFYHTGQSFSFPPLRDQMTTPPPQDPIYSSLTYQGSSLSILDEPWRPAWLTPVKNFFLGVNSLELLSPELMRSRPRQSAGSVGARGEALAAYIYEMTDQQRQRLIDRLQSAYQQLESVQSKPLRAGWKQLSVTESFAGRSLHTEARHINDGMLRMMALLSEMDSDHTFLLFDEIENGVNVELVQFLVETLVKARQQILVTTHSPVILNYLTEEVAKEAMIYLYKSADGVTHAIRFFDIPRMAKKLTMMGPGEAYGDTDLLRLNREIIEAQTRPVS